MPPYLWPDPEAERQRVAAAQSTWSRIRQQAQTATPGQAQSLSTMYANYPHMRPGVALPLARAGMAPDHPVVQQVATAEAKRNKKNRGWWGALQDLVPNPGHIGLFPEAGEQFVRHIVNPVGGGALTALKGITRTGTAMFDFPRELLMGGYRDIAASTGNIGAGIAGGAMTGTSVGRSPAGAVAGAITGGILGAIGQARGVEIESQGVQNPLTQTTLGQQFTGHDVGSGFFAMGGARDAAVRVQQAAASINGHALTPGRHLAATVLEPGSKPYALVSGLVDTANAWRLDPAVPITKATLSTGARWQQARRVFDPDQLKRDAGVVEGVRNTVLPELVEQFKQSKQGATAGQWFAEQKDFEAVRQALPGVDIGTVHDLWKAETPEDVWKVLDPKLGQAKGLMEKPRVGGWGFEVRRKASRDWRLLQDLPTGKLNWNDPTDAVHQFDLLQSDAKIAREVRSVNNQRLAEHLLSGTPEGRLKADELVLTEFLGHVGDQAGEGVGEVTRQLAKRVAKDRERIYGALVNEDGTQTAVKAVSWGGKSTGLAPSGMLADYISDGIAMDRNAIRDIRATTSRWAPLFTNKAVKIGTTAGEYLTNDIWKPTALLRGAWTVRVIGEEQVRMAAAGRMSMFNHPLSYLAWAMDDDTKIAGILKKARVPVGRGQVGFEGERFSQRGTKGLVSAADDDLERELRGAADEYHAALGQRQEAEGWHTGGTMVRAKHQVAYEPGMEDYHKAWVEQIDKLHSDPLVRELARTGDVEATRRLFTTEGEDLNEVRKLLVQKGAPLERSVDVDAHIAAAHKNLVEAAGGTFPETFEQGLPGLGTARPGDQTVLTAIATGDVGGIPLRDTRGMVNGQAAQQLRRLEIEGPAQVIGTGYKAAAGKDAFLAAKDDAIERAFGFFMTRPSAKLSRSPMFRQTYWDEAENLIWKTDEVGQDIILENAVKAKLPKEQINRLKAAAKKGVGDLTAEQADVLAKGNALDATRDLLYDAANRGQLSDVMRIVAPFLEAQKEVMKVWARIGTESPQVARRAQQLIQGARGNGWFFTDEQTGEEMFTFPMGDLLTEHMPFGPHMKIPLVGRVQGLNMFGSGIMPGVGPAVQIPVRWMIPDKPQYDDLRTFLDPFGATAGEERGIIEQNLPGWVTKLQTAYTADEGDRVFANTVKDVWAQGLSEGRYSADTPDDIRKGLDDAKHAARGLYAIRGLASVLGAPTAPTPRMMAKDKDGHWIVAEKLAQDYKKMTDDPNIGWQNASRVFVEKYGNNAAAFIQAKTYSTVAQATTTTDAAAWMRDHPEIADKYRKVAGLFAPQGEEFDYTAYLRNIKAGTTINLTPEQYVRAANDRVGKMIFYNYKDRMGPSPSQEQRQWLSQLRDAIRQAYPGFDETLPGKPDKETVKKQFIPEIERAVNDPALAKNDVARAAKLYLQARAQAQAAAVTAGHEGFQQPKDMEATRDWLRQVADVLQRAVPDFAPMWDRAFERELIEDVPTPGAEVTV